VISSEAICATRALLWLISIGERKNLVNYCNNQIHDDMFKVLWYFVKIYLAEIYAISVL